MDVCLPLTVMYSQEQADFISHLYQSKITCCGLAQERHYSFRGNSQTLMPASQAVYTLTLHQSREAKTPYF